MGNFKEIEFPTDFEYSSDSPNLPIDFFAATLPISKQIYLKLGYFSSSAIKVLAYGFAQFIYNGGIIKIISNHHYQPDDIVLTHQHNNKQNTISAHEFLRDLDWLNHSLSAEGQHFINCLRFLVENNRLELIPVLKKPNSMVHYKEGIFVDENDDVIYMNGSCNFTASGLLENAENISVYRSWGGEFETNKLSAKRKNISSIINKENVNYTYLHQSDLVEKIKSNSDILGIKELIIKEKELIKRIKNVKLKGYLTEMIDKTIGSEVQAATPAFPYPEGPREYQNEAYINWKNSDKCGLFAMATGTGKTITALNCILEEYKQSGYYQAIIVVPSKPLVNQWYEEARNFNFNTVMKVYSDSQWKEKLSRMNTGMALNAKHSFLIITTYISFSSENFQRRITNFPKATIFVADEAHNIGSERMKQLLPGIKFEKRIALSATPKRRFDPEGNSLIESYFNTSEPYTFSYSMKKAINENILTQYYYYPHMVYLNSQEMRKYVIISKKLSKIFNQKTKKFTNPDYAKILLLERKRIIHKAENKKNTLNTVLKEISESKYGINYSFIYAPEGEDDSGTSMLADYLSIFEDCFPDKRIHHFTSKTENRTEILKDFESGYINCLISMKCLDEGIDIPRAGTAIFCSSTGNPRQFIQRRGRVLRKHKDKDLSVIHDLVVFPELSESIPTAIERKLVKDELERFIYFSSLAINYYEAMNSFQTISQRYGHDIFALQDELGEVING